MLEDHILYNPELSSLFVMPPIICMQTVISLVNLGERTKPTRVTVLISERVPPVRPETNCSFSNLLLKAFKTSSSTDIEVQ